MGAWVNCFAPHEQIIIMLYQPELPGILRSPNREKRILVQLSGGLHPYLQADRGRTRVWKFDWGTTDHKRVMSKKKSIAVFQPANLIGRPGIKRPEPRSQNDAKNEEEYTAGCDLHDRRSGSHPNS